jgi:diaminopimelate epimerase
MSATVAFEKMQGIGNDFIMLDALRDTLPDDLAALARWTQGSLPVAAQTV